MQCALSLLQPPAGCSQEHLHGTNCKGSPQGLGRLSGTSAGASGIFSLNYSHTTEIPCCLSLPSVMAAPAEGSALSLGGYGAGYRCPQPLGGKERVRGDSGAGRAQSKNPWLCLWVRPGGKLSRIRVLWSWLLGSGSLA